MVVWITICDSLNDFKSYLCPQNKEKSFSLTTKKKYQIEQFYTTLLSSAERIILLSNRLTNTDRLIGVLNRCFYSILSGDMCDKHL